MNKVVSKGYAILEHPSLPSVQYVHADLLRRFLGGIDVVIRRRLPEIVVRYMSESTFADEQTRLGTCSIDLLREFIPQRQSFSRVGRALDHGLKRGACGAGHELGETEALVVRKVA